LRALGRIEVFRSSYHRDQPAAGYAIFHALPANPVPNEAVEPDDERKNLPKEHEPPPALQQIVAQPLNAHRLYGG